MGWRFFEQTSGTRLKWSSRFIVFILFLFALTSLGVITARADGNPPPPESDTPVDIVPGEEVQPVESGNLIQAIETSTGLQVGEGQGDFTETPATEDTASGSLLESGQAAGLVPDPYFFVDGTQYSFLPEGGDCAGTEHCQVSATPIQDALDAISNGLLPDNYIIYIDGGNYYEDIHIDTYQNLILQGSTGQSPSIITGSLTITNSSNIALYNLLLNGTISICDSSNIYIGENITVAGTVDSLQAELSNGDLLIGDGQSSNVDGSLQLKGENVTVSGDITADEIYIESNETTYVSGKLSAPGGTIHILGDRVALIDDANVDVSEQNGGGTVLIGGDYQGKGTVPNAQQTYVGPNVAIHADALDNGNGGYVIVWANETTQFYGTISANGGPKGGNGGFVETSGKDFLEVIGASVSASASLGQAGTWLMDPHNVEIKTAVTTNGSFNGGIPNVFTPTADTAVVNDAEIENSLNLGTSVTITTSSTGTVELGDITVSASIFKNAGGDATLTLEAANDIILNAPITSSVGRLNLVLSADADKDQVGTVLVQAIISTNDGNITIQGDTVNIFNTVDAGAGTILLEPSVNSINTILGPISASGFNPDNSDLGFIVTTGGLTIGQSGGSGDVSIDSVSLSGMNVVIKGRNVTFDGGAMVLSNGSLQINASGSIIDNNGVGLNIQLTAGGPYLIIDAVGAVGSSADPIETQVSNLAAESDAGGVFIYNTGALNISWFARLDGQSGASGTFVDGIIANGGVTLTAASPLTVNRAIHENAGGDINLTAGNNSSQLGDNLTINADVIITGSTGKITGNAGDNIIVKSSVRMSAPEGVFFNSGLDGTADDDNGTTSISGILQATKAGAPIYINSPYGITISLSGQIITNGGNVTLQAVNGKVTQNGTITLNGGSLMVIEQPPVLPPNVLVMIPSQVIAAVVTETGTALAAAAEAATSAILSVVNGQQVSLLDAAALGSILTLQLPNGIGVTFPTGVNALVSMVSNVSMALPAPLPSGFIALSNLLIDFLPQDETAELGEILIAFGAPTGLAEVPLFILHWDEQVSQWAEISINETTAAQITALSDAGGYFVLAKQAEENKESLQSQLSGITEQPAVLQVGQNQVTVSGAAGDLVTVTLMGDPGNLPDGMRFLDGVQVEVTLNDAKVNILPVGESIQIAFSLPEGTEGTVTILYWLPTLNSGQGGWTELTAHRSAEGKLELETFFGGEFILAAH